MQPLQICIGPTIHRSRELVSPVCWMFWRLRWMHMLAMSLMDLTVNKTSNTLMVETIDSQCQYIIL